MKKHIICGLEVTFYRNNIHIEDSHTIKSKKQMSTLLKCARELAKSLYDYKYKRTNASWSREWEAHNLLYTLGIEKKRTGSVDLNEDESKTRRFGYFALSLLYFEKKTDC